MNPHDALDDEVGRLIALLDQGFRLAVHPTAQPALIAALRKPVKEPPPPCNGRINDVAIAGDGMFSSARTEPYTLLELAELVFGCEIYHSALCGLDVHLTKKQQLIAEVDEMMQSCRFCAIVEATHHHGPSFRRVVREAMAFLGGNPDLVPETLTVRQLREEANAKMEVREDDGESETEYDVPWDDDDFLATRVRVHLASAREIETALRRREVIWVPRACIAILTMAMIHNLGFNPFSYDPALLDDFQILAAVQYFLAVRAAIPGRRLRH